MHAVRAALIETNKGEIRLLMFWRKKDGEITERELAVRGGHYF